MIPLLLNESNNKKQHSCSFDHDVSTPLFYEHFLKHVFFNQKIKYLLVLGPSVDSNYEQRLTLTYFMTRLIALYREDVYVFTVKRLF